MNQLSLQEPYYLLFIPLFILLHFYFKPKRTSYYIPKHIYKHTKRQSKTRYLYTLLQWSVIILATIALASPTIKKSVKDTHKQSIDIVLSLDTSGSMSLYGFNENNYTQTRLQAVKEVVKSFIHTRKEERIGVVIFGDYSSVAAPLSYDYETPLDIIRQIDIGVVGKNTALIDSIASATELLKQSSAKSKVIILLSDGEDVGSKIPLEIALKFAKKYHIKVYTISIGESNNNILKLISKETGAKNFTATNKADLTEVYKSIDKLEKSQTETPSRQVTKQIYFYFLMLATLAALLMALLRFHKREL